jgi:dolichol-phosphate mannosyltransferase
MTGDPRDATPAELVIPEDGVPRHTTTELRDRSSRYCVLICVIDEGERILGQLERMRAVPDMPDVVIADGGSTDGSMEPDRLRSLGVRALLVKTDGGKLGAQQRIGFAYALREGYEGVITVDGNGKDDVRAVPRFVEQLDAGYDLVQGSRYVPGGKAENTPLSRTLALKLIHAPALSLASGFRYTDTTNAFRAHSRRLLAHPELQPFRPVFTGYELLAYVSSRAPRIEGMRVAEVPVRRSYPPRGATPTKISPLKGNLELLRVLARASLRSFDP